MNIQKRMQLQDYQSLLKGSGNKIKRIKLQAKCSQGNQSNLACNNSNCKEYAFVCNNKSCECRILHRKCLFTCPAQILELIRQKRSQSSDVIDKTCQIFDKWIDKISKTRQNIQNLLLDWGLTGPQKKFIQLIKKSQYKELTGFYMSQITSQTTQYFKQETKQKLISQIQNTARNYDSQIDSILNTVVSLFQKYQVAEKQAVFKQIQDISFQQEYNFCNDIQSFVYNMQNMNKGNPVPEDYNKLMNYLKIALKKDFIIHMQGYKRQRRMYGSRKLRKKYFQDYFSTLNKGFSCMQKWKEDTTKNIQSLSKSIQVQLKQLSTYHHQFSCFIHNPFTPELALSLQKSISTIFLLTKFVKQNGKQLLRPLVQHNKVINQNFIFIVYYLDQFMDQHPEIDEIQLFWNSIWFEDKLKNQINALIQAVDQAYKNPIIIQAQFQNQ